MSNPVFFLGDCAEKMRDLAPNSVDAIVTDPPYGLSFMGRNWDHGVPGEAFWREALRVAKPGAHLLAFGGTRTYHRLACAIEDAGWEIRDCIMWVYGSGFPKSMDVSKAIDKMKGAQRTEVIGLRHRNVKPYDDGNGWNANNTTGDYQYMAPATPEAAEWQGWGTCLKPAVEPIVVARKPLEGTVAANVLKYGTGGINIDGCRVPTSDELSTHGDSRLREEKSAQVYGSYKPAKRGQTDGQKLGRFPANLVHDGSDEVLALFPDTGKSSGGGGFKAAATGGIYWNYSPKDNPKNVGLGDEGSAARFFYCAKASRSERGEGNVHPTVKPIALMRWLVRLVTRKGGLVLDPFMGSGTTGVAAVEEGMRFVGIERDEHYMEIATRRIAGAKPPDERQAAPHVEQMELPLNNQEEKEAEERSFKMTDYLTRVCPNCGGRLCVNSSDPERVYCDTCEYEENAEYVKLSKVEDEP